MTGRNVRTKGSKEKRGETKTDEERQREARKTNGNTEIQRGQRETTRDNERQR